MPLNICNIYAFSSSQPRTGRASNQDQQAMHDDLETKVRQRAYEMRENESRTASERHWLEAEREMTDEAENAAVSRWAAPVSGTYVEESNEAAGIAAKPYEAAAPGVAHRPRPVRAG
jgi:hypothetical protein